VESENTLGTQAQDLSALFATQSFWDLRIAGDGPPGIELVRAQLTPLFHLFLALAAEFLDDIPVNIGKVAAVAGD